jgi:hypothetical protein
LWMINNCCRVDNNSVSHHTISCWR